MVGVFQGLAGLLRQGIGFHMVSPKLAIWYGNDPPKRGIQFRMVPHTAVRCSRQGLFPRELRFLRLHQPAVDDLT